MVPPLEEPIVKAGIQDGVWVTGWCQHAAVAGMTGACTAVAIGAAGAIASSQLACSQYMQSYITVHYALYTRLAVI